MKHVSARDAQSMIRRFRDRAEAGRALGAMLRHYARRPDVLVLALPRGGVPVAVEVTLALDVPMDIFIVRKLGTPGQKELAMGAIASGGVRVLNEDVVRLLKIPGEVIDTVAAEEQQEIERREREYRGERSTPDLRGRTVILVDDGLATGSSMHAAVAALRQRRPARIVVAVPVAPPSTLKDFEDEADEVVCVLAPEEPFEGVGRWYLDFSQITDDEVRQLLDRSSSKKAPSQI
jgi:putative phosphoribosyl transferase